MTLDAQTAEILRRRATEAERNRAAFPFANRIVSDLRAAGFEQAKVTYAKEGDRERGRQGDPGVTASRGRG